MINPLLTQSLLPSFSTILPKHVIPAVQLMLDKCYATIEQVVTQLDPFTWDNLCQPIAEVNNQLNHIWSPVNHLHAVKDSPALREVYEQSLLLLSEYNTWVGQHKGLYDAYRNLREGKYFAPLSLAQKKAVDNTIRNFELSGIHLASEKQLRYGQIIIRLSELSSSYSNNIMDATIGWSKLVTNKLVLTGVPESVLIAARTKAEAQGQNGWLLTLDIPSYLPIITYCDNAAIREELYFAYHTRASDQGPNAGKWDNGPVMNEILMLRYELAQVLSFNSYADISLATKMAENPQQVLDFLINLTKLVHKQGKQELVQLYAFTKQYYGHETLNPWDISYYAEKQKQHLFSISDDQLRSYFPEPMVVSGLFKVVNRIYGITVKERTNVETWHAEVRFFDLFDEKGDLKGSFYLDLYARNNKHSGAWMDECTSRMRKADGKLQKPIAYLVCNFNRPINGKPALFTHSEVITLFHEFGHGLQHMLTNIETMGVSGISGIPWDAVEIPSQFMENYCWQSAIFVLISNHYETGRPLPTNLVSKLLEAKNYHAALFILHQLELSMFDFRIHYEFNPKNREQVFTTLAEVKKQVAVLPIVEWDRVPHTFSHIFSGSYAGGYYSYLWSNVLAADAWSRFEQEGIFNRTTGASFLDNFLSCGGSEEPITLFTRFRGRKPRLDAMLNQYGIIEKSFNYYL